MTKFFRAVLLFLQCLITWPWAIPWFLVVILITKWNLRNNPFAWIVVWGDAKILMREDWRRRLAWVRLGV